MNITVNAIRTYELPITVTIKEDGFITFCNHAGSGLEEVITDRFDPDSGRFIFDDSEYRVVCDKCMARLIETNDGEEWIDCGV